MNKAPKIELYESCDRFYEHIVRFSFLSYDAR